MANYIKVRFHTEGGVERMRVKVVKEGMLDGKKVVYGTLANKPVFGDKKHGASVIIPVDDILDTYND